MTEHRPSMRDKEELILQFKSYKTWRPLALLRYALWLILHCSRIFASLVT